MWPIGRKRIIEMQSCCFEFVRSTAHFCSDMMTLGSGFPLKQGNLGNVIWSPGLPAKWRMFVWHCYHPTVGSVPWVCPLSSTCKGTPSPLWPAARRSIAMPQGAASGWDLQYCLLRISWSFKVLSICCILEAERTCEGSQWEPPCLVTQRAPGPSWILTGVTMSD